MHIVHVASEMAPIAKAGGLADAVTGMAKQLRKEHHVSVILPYYSFIRVDQTKLKLHSQFICEKKRISYNVRIFEVQIENVLVHLVETSPLLDHFYEEKIYLGTQKDSERFIYFCNTVAEYLIRKNQEIDVLHLHDWHTALLAPLVKEVYLSLKVLIKSVVITIHNLAYTGKFFLQELEDIYYPMKNISYFTKKGFFFNYYFLLQAALLLSDAIIAVSPGYAQEILTKQYACGFLDILQKRKDAIYGVLNGIDEELWNPGNDPCLPFTFCAQDSIEKIFHAKKKNKEELQKRLGLEQKDVPLFICISRLVAQKNPKLMKKGLLFAHGLCCQAVLLGSSPEKKEQAHFEQLAYNYATDKNIRFIAKFDEPLSRLLYAAADFLLMPSNFEPCGLAQMIAMKYGCTPIVSHVGGLKDTVFDPRYTKNTDKANGFYFTSGSKKQMQDTITIAISYWKKNRCAPLVKNGMSTDWSWKTPAKNYVAIYEKTLL